MDRELVNPPPLEHRFRTLGMAPQDIKADREFDVIVYQELSHRVLLDFGPQMTPESNPQPARPSHYRWVICGLLLAAMAINYIQRQTIGLLKTPLQHEFALDEVGYANIVFWFQAAYALGYVSFGRVLDRIGTRTGYAVAFILWNLSHMAAGLAATSVQFTLARVGLGLGESGARFRPASRR